MIGSNFNMLIIGHLQHGKDTLAGIIHDCYGLTFTSSSQIAAEIFIYDALKEKYNYQSFEECFEDRKHHRAEWFNLICAYKFKDKARLAKEILQKADMYVGMRSDDELQECLRQDLFDLIIGIYDPRKPEEPKDSFNIDIFKESDFIIYNNSTLENLEKKVKRLNLPKKKVLDLNAIL